MRKSVVFSTFVTITAGSVGASALDGVEMLGSDTLYEITTSILTTCPGATTPAPGVVYEGTGSSNGETAMSSGAQTIAPMSRYLKEGAADRPCTTQGNGVAAEGIAVARDGLSVVVADATGGLCQTDTDCNRATNPNTGLAYNTNVTYGSGSTYTFADWKDVLKVVYGGLSSLSTTRDCNSAIRRAVVDDYGNLFQQQNCGTGTCTQLQHAFRRDDTSGTTDTFLSITGIAKFCNVLDEAEAVTVGATTANVYESDFQDQDKIRRDCAGTNDPATTTNQTPTEQVCGADGTLGVVLPVYPVDYLSVAQSFPTSPCTTRMIAGEAPLDPYSGSASGYGDCPNGDSAFFINRCLIPVDGSGNANCLASATTRPLFTFSNDAAASADGRVYNLHLRASGTSGDYLRDIKPEPRQIAGAFYRIHSTRTMSTADNTAGTCQNQDATSQIGCLAAASPCSIGFAGVAATSAAGATYAKLNATEPTESCVESSTYPFWRYLWLNTLVGFEDVTGQERELAECFALQGGSVAQSLGFYGMSAPLCRDFNESACPGYSGTNVNSCTDNTAPIPNVDAL